MRKTLSPLPHLYCLRVSAVLLPVSCSLQQIGNDLVKPISTISATQSKLQTWRKDEENEFTLMFEEELILGKKMGVSKEEMQSFPRTINKSVLRSNACGTNQTAFNDARINVFFPLLDEVCGDMKARFTSHQ